MEKYIYDEKNGLWYELQGDYYIPCLKLPDEEQRPIGIWGQRHLRYLRQHRKALYTELQITGKLNGYLADLNEQAENMFLELVKQLAVREGVTEQLKVQDQMLWVQRINNIRDRAMEVVNNDLIMHIDKRRGAIPAAVLCQTDRRTASPTWAILFLRCFSSGSRYSYRKLRQSPHHSFEMLQTILQGSFPALSVHRW